MSEGGREGGSEGGSEGDRERESIFDTKPLIQQALTLFPFYTPPT